MAATTGATYAEAGVQTSSIRTPPRVSGDHVFKTPTLPLAKPLTQKPIVIERPSDYSNTCIRREELKSLDLDILKDYAEVSSSAPTHYTPWTEGLCNSHTAL